MRAGVRRLAPPLLLAVALACATAPLATRAAVGPGITLTVQPGYGFSGGGSYRLNGPTQLQANDVWVPVHLTLHNESNSDTTPRLVIHDDNTQNAGGPAYRTDYTLDMTLPAGSRKAVTMYVRASDVTAGLTLDLMAGGSVVTTASIAPSPQQSGNLSVGVLSDDTATRTILRSIKLGDTALSVAQFDAAAPLDGQPQALENFDLIVASNYASDALTAAQTAALRSWVQRGGTLLVAGGPDVQKTMGHIPTDLLAATIGAGQPTRMVAAAPELARIAGDAVPASGPVELSVATPRAGARVLARSNGVPLAVDLPVGRGHLVYSALEPTLAPFNTWPVGAQGDFWGHLLEQPLAGPLDALVQNGMQSEQPSFPAPGSTSTPITGDLLPARTLPSLQLYSILIVLYIVVLGPLNYAILRWRRHLEWSWVTVPAVAALFGLASFGLAYARNGGDVIANVDAVVYLDPGASSKLVDSYIGVFAPFHGDYTVSTAGPGLGWSLGGDSGSQAALSSGRALGLRVDEGAQFSAQLLGLQMWSIRTLGVRQQIPLAGAVTGQLVVHKDIVSGTVMNGTDLTLRNCTVVGLNGASGQIRLIGPHQTVAIPPFSLANLSNSVGVSGSSGGVGPLTNLYGAPSGNGPGSGPSSGSGTARYANILNAVFPSGSVATSAAPLTLIGWSTESLGHFTVNGATPRRNDLDLVVAPLSMELAPGRFNLAPGDVPVAAAGTTVVPSTGSNSGLTLNAGDHLEVQLVVPPSRGHVDVQTLTLQISPTSGSSLAQNGAQVWDWAAGRWKTVDLSSGPVTLHGAARYVGPDGRVRLRAQAPQNSISFAAIEQNMAIGAAGVVR